MVMRMLRTQIKWIMLSVAVVFVLSLLFMYGPMGGGGSGDGETKDYAVATLDGTKIMRSSIEMGLRDAVERANLQEVTSADLPALRKSVLQNIILTHELEKEAKARGIAVTDQEVDDVVAEIKDQFPTVEAYDQYLERSGIEMKALRENIARQLAQQKVFEGELSSVVLGEEEIAEFYDKTKEVFFRRPEGFNLNVAHLSVEDLAREAAEKINVQGDWDGALNILSSDVRDHTPYDQPVFVASEALASHFGQVLSADMNVAVGPFEVASDDFVVIMKREALPDQILPLDEVSGDISNLLLSQKRSEVQHKFFHDLIERANVTVHDEELFAVPAVPEPASKDLETASGDAAQKPLSQDAKKTASQEGESLSEDSDMTE